MARERLPRVRGLVRGALAVAAALGLVLAAAGAARAERPVVILLSWDGVRHDYLERAELPGLARLAREGLRAERLLPVFPSNTFPGHVSLATGTYPDRHGIVDNRFWDRERGLFDYSNDASWIEAEPLWIAAERQGVRAAVFFWVGSETEWRGRRASYRRRPFDSAIGEGEKVRQILAWLDRPEAERPRLVMGWWHGADSAGHRKGPDHPDVVAALAEQDRHLRDLLAGLDARDAWDSTTLLVVSDHGMTEGTGRVDPGTALREAGIAVRLVAGSSLAHVFLEEPARAGEAEAALSGLDGVEVHRREAIPESLRIRHPTRTGDLVLRTRPPLAFRGARGRLAGLYAVVVRWLGGSVGLHGYAPEHPDMGAILLAAGRGVAKGRRIGPVRAVDVAPTVAGLLGIEPPRHSEGTRIPGIAAPAGAAAPDAPRLSLPRDGRPEALGLHGEQ